MSPITSAAATEPGLELLVAEAAPVDQPAVHGDAQVERGRVTAVVDSVEVQIPLDGDEPVEVHDGVGSVAIDALPGVELAAGRLLDGGSVSFPAKDGTTLFVQPTGTRLKADMSSKPKSQRSHDGRGSLAAPTS